MDDLGGKRDRLVEIHGIGSDCLRLCHLPTFPTHYQGHCSWCGPGSYTDPDIWVEVREVPHKSHEPVRGRVDPGKFEVTGKHQNVGSRKQRDVQQRGSYVVLCRNTGLTFFHLHFNFLYIYESSLSL